MARRLAVAWLLAISLAVVAVSGGAAHAALTGTDPVNGSVLEQQPPYLTLMFNERVELNADGLRLFDSAANVTILEGTQVDTSIQATLPNELADGSYVLSWRVTSADGHPISGVLSFAIGTASAAPVVAPDLGNDPWVERLLGIVQGVGYAGLLATTGLVAFVLVVQRTTLNAVPRLALLTSIVSILAYLLALPLTVARQQGLDLGSVFDVGRWTPDLDGTLTLSTAIVILGLLLAVVAVPRLPTLPMQGVVAALSLGAAVAALSMLGHTRIHDPAWLIVGSNVLHTATGAIWFGGLIGLVSYLRRAARSNGADASNPDVPAVAVVVARFSVLAGVLVGLLAVSGVVSSWIILESPGDLVSTDYGRLLVLKAGIAGVALLIAAWNHFRLVPAVSEGHDDRLRWLRLRKAVSAEAGLLVAVVLVTGFLVNQSPQETEASAVAPPAVTAMLVEFTDELGDGSVEGTIDPATTGANHVMLQLLDADGQPFTPEGEPHLQLSLPSADLGPLAATAMPTGEPGHYMAEMDIPLAGTWDLAIVVRVSTFEEPIARVVVVIP